MTPPTHLQVFNTTSFPIPGVITTLTPLYEPPIRVLKSLVLEGAALGDRNRAYELFDAGVLGEQNVAHPQAVRALGVARLVPEARALPDGVRPLAAALNAEVRDRLVHLDRLVIEEVVTTIQALHDRVENVVLTRGLLDFLDLLLLPRRHRNRDEFLVRRGLDLRLRKCLIHYLHVLVHENMSREDGVLELVLVQVLLCLNSIVDVVEVKESMVGADNDPGRVDQPLRVAVLNHAGDDLHDVEVVIPLGDVAEQHLRREVALLHFAGSW